MIICHLVHDDSRVAHRAIIDIGEKEIHFHESMDRLESLAVPRMRLHNIPSINRRNYVGRILIMDPRGVGALLLQTVEFSSFFLFLALMNMSC